MAKCIIGGVSYTVPELNFVALERAWPFIEESMLHQHPMKGPAAGLSVIAAGLCEDLNFDRAKFNIPDEEVLTDEEVFEAVTWFLKKKLKASEISNVATCMTEITEEAGLVPEEGEGLLSLVAKVGGESPSTETAPSSSPNSSPQDAKAEAGKD